MRWRNKSFDFGINLILSFSSQSWCRPFVSNFPLLPPAGRP
jgi:hypothetical protein